MSNPVFKMREDDDVFTLTHSSKGTILTDIFENYYEVVGSFLASDDFYQGLEMTAVIRGLKDNILYGLQWWDDISKYGESHVESNGGQHGYDGECEVEDDWDTFVSYYVFTPVERWEYVGYRAT